MNETAAHRPARGFTAVSMVITLVVVAVLAAVVVRVSWGFASSAGGGTELTVPSADGDGPTATLPEGEPPEVAGSIVLSTHAQSISAQANAAAQLSGIPVYELSDGEILAGYPSSDGTHTVTARVASRSNGQVEVHLSLDDGATDRCFDVESGAGYPAAC